LLNPPPKLVLPWAWRRPRYAQQRESVAKALH
jgi:hypothetical protein